MRTCGNCVHFIRVKKWGGSRNGMCGSYDYNCKTDSSYAKQCKGFKAKKYNRRDYEHKQIETIDAAVEDYMLGV